MTVGKAAAGRLAKRLATKGIPQETVDFLLEDPKPTRQKRYDRLTAGVFGQRLANRVKRVPEKVAATDAKTPNLDTNLFAFLLAARTKQDVHTKLVGPKTMWTKFGIEGLEFRPIGWKSRTLGPRGYQTCAIDEISKGFGHILAKKPCYKKYTQTPRFLDDLAEMERNALNELLKNYEPEGPIILTTNGQAAHGLAIQSQLEVPAEITVGKKRTGLALAAFVYRQFSIDRLKQTKKGL